MNLVKTLIVASVAACCLAKAAAVHAEEPSRPWNALAAGEVLGVNEAGRIEIEFHGNSTHLGRYTTVGEHEFVSDLEFVGLALWTAANGAELHVLYEGTLHPIAADQPIPFTIIATVLDGTGRFQDAGGVGEIEGVLVGTATSGTFAFELAGDLSY